MTDPDCARRALDQTGFWQPKAGACAIESLVDGEHARLIGTLQFYGAGPGIHGLEIGYILHNEDDRGKGYASEALRLFSDLLFAEHPECHRLQLIIETWNDASARLAEDCGYASEGILRKAGYSSPDRAQRLLRLSASRPTTEPSARRRLAVRALAFWSTLVGAVLWPVRSSSRAPCRMPTRA